jgi:hypothetical protein
MASQSDSSAFPGFSSVYLLGEPGNSRAFRGRMSLSVEEAFALTRDERSFGTVDVRWAMGGATPSDFVFTTIAAPLVAADRVVEILRAESFTGWKPYEVNLVGKDEAKIPGYHGLAVSGRCGRIENERSVRFEKTMPGGVFSYWRGLYFDPASWDGSDVFSVKGKPSWIFVVHEVKRALERAKVNNLTFCALDKVERMEIEMKMDLDAPQ